MSASGTSRILVDGASLATVTKKVLAAAGLGTPRRTEHRYRVAKDIGDVKVPAGVAFKDRTA